MVIFTAKLNKKRLFAVAAVIVIAAAAFLLSRPHGQPYDADDVLGSSSADVGGIKTNEDRLAYISSLGYSVAAEPLSEKEVVIPETFDETYTQYNALQQQCGFDLTRYMGETVTQYVYSILEYEGAEDVQLELLVCDNKVIGGSVYTVAVDGFMRGLSS